MLCMLLEVLRFDRIAGQRGSACERDVAFVIPFGIANDVGGASRPPQPTKVT
jgi:hypothetical protein